MSRAGDYSVCTNLASDFCFDSTFGQKGTKRILCSHAVGDKAVDIASSPQDELKYWIVEDVANANGLNWNGEDSKKNALALHTSSRGRRIGSLEARTHSIALDNGSP